MELLEPIQKSEIQYGDLQRRRLYFADIIMLICLPQVQLFELIYGSFGFLERGSYYYTFEYSILYLEEQLYIDTTLRIKSKINKITQTQLLNEIIIQLIAFVIIMVILVFQDTIINASCGESVIQERNILLMATASLLYVLAEAAALGNLTFAINFALPIQLLVVQFTNIIGMPLSVGQLMKFHAALGFVILVASVAMNFKQYSFKSLGSIRRFREVFMIIMPELCMDICSGVIDAAIAAQTFARFSELSLARGILYNFYCSFKSSCYFIMDEMLPFTKDFKIDNYIKYFSSALAILAISGGISNWAIIFIERLLFGGSHYEGWLYYGSIFIIAACAPFMQIMYCKLFSLGAGLAVQLLVIFHVLFASYIFYTSLRHPWFRDTYFMNALIAICEVAYLGAMLAAVWCFPLVRRRIKRQ